MITIVQSLGLWTWAELYSLQPPTTEPVSWGVWVAVYTFFSGIAAGSYTVAALGYVFDYRRFRPLVPFALLVAAVALITAMSIVGADFGRPERTFHILLRPNVRSMLAWVIGMYGVFCTALVSMLIAVLRPAWARRAAQTGGRIPKLLSFGYVIGSDAPYGGSLLLKVLGIAGLTCALGLAGGVDAFFSVIRGRAFWHAGLFPITFMSSALLSGLSCVLGGASLLGRGGMAWKSTLITLGRLVGYVVMVDLIILPAETLIIVNGAIPWHLNALKAISAGPCPWVFWVLQVGVGMFSPLLLIFLPRRASLAAVSVASLGALVGAFALRVNCVIPELAAGELSVGGGHAALLPTLSEWSLAIFGIALAGTLTFIGSKLLPVFSGDTPLDFEHAARGNTPNWNGLRPHQH